MGRKGKRSDLGRALNRKRQRDKEAARAVGDNPSQLGPSINGEQGKLHSVLDATDLEEFMLNATMANEDFAAERYPHPLAPQTVVVSPLDQTKVPTSANMEKRKKLDETVLRIPRRPAWDSNTTPAQLFEKETDEFLKWRRKIASLEEEHRLSSSVAGPMMTPFEKNIEVWRQLWRVVERSDVVVQIVDARNPLLYYCEDMYRYVTVEMGRSHLLVLNKSDLLSNHMIDRWESYFKSQGKDVIFFSAFNASVNESADNSRVVGVRDLIEKFRSFGRKAPIVQPNQRLVVGMCGYPNVGKSSTINVLLESFARNEGDQDGQNPEQSIEALDSSSNNEGTEATDASVDIPRQPRRVAVSSTPGKTKHFQTLVLTDEVLLCDCPGLVFPNFSSSKSELICAGVLSIDQMRGDYLSPVSLIAARIPASIFEGVYGIRFPSLVDGIYSDTEDLLRAAPGYVSATMLLDTHARARGFMSDHGKPDQSRSTRVLLKDYVNGRIIFAHAPPPRDIEDGESGIGPGVHAKKGALVYKRQEAAQVSSMSKPTNVSRYENGLQELRKGLKGENDASSVVKARVSGSKKHEHEEFTRVHRSYYPAV